MTWRGTEIPASLLAADRSDAAFGSIYENSGWIAAAALSHGDAPPGTFGALADRMRAAVDAAPREAQLALLRAHPELASRAALAGDLTPDSHAEQRGAGLDRCSPEELLAIRTLNARYGKTFGFPFIVAVTGLARSDIIAALERRCESSFDAEFAEGLAQVHRIAALRLAALAAQPGPTS